LIELWNPLLKIAAWHGAISIVVVVFVNRYSVFISGFNCPKTSRDLIQDTPRSLGYCRSSMIPIPRYFVPPIASPIISPPRENSGIARVLAVLDSSRASGPTPSSCLAFPQATREVFLSCSFLQATTETWSAILFYRHQ
jgi:hypothetical protein